MSTQGGPANSLQWTPRWWSGCVDIIDPAPRRPGAAPVDDSGVKGRPSSDDLYKH